MNVIGERQHPEKFLPKIINHVSKHKTLTIHSNKTKTKAGSRFYIHAKDVADAMLFLLTKDPERRLLSIDKNNWSDEVGVGKDIKFNIVGPEEIDNLSLAKMIGECQGKEAITEMVDFHSARPGHDLRYALDGGLMKSIGWEPKLKFSERIQQVSDWYLSNNKWLEI